MFFERKGASKPHIDRENREVTRKTNWVIGNLSRNSRVTWLASSPEDPSSQPGSTPKASVVPRLIHSMKRHDIYAKNPTA